MTDPKDTKPKTKLVEIEEKILSFWAKNSIFKKSLKKGKEFVFYDGPPFANGHPHYGHMLASFIKDTVPRYKTMQGYSVSRRWGWDCHGLPVENLVEKELNLKSKRDIQEYGLEKFNAVAKESVLRYADDWRKQIPRIGRFVDMENDYRTMDASYTESVWWVFKTLYDKGLIYEGFKSMQVCPRCGTTLSNFEVNQGYKDITDISVFVKFESVEEPNVYFLAWTTTPWTLPGNVALAVGKDIDYARVSYEGKTYILARDLVASVFAGKEHSLEGVVEGSALVGKKYKPVFTYYATEATKGYENGWRVYAADFVTIEDGTGIVHIAPAFGEDDMKLGERQGLPFVQHVGMDGKFKKEVLDFAGEEVKPKAGEKDGHQKTDIEIIKWLAHKGFLFDKKKIVHSYPHCWRCDTPLLNYAASSWFVKVTAFKNKLVAANKRVSWVPEDIRDGRFGKWLENARDWAISRSRFWGAPIPVWRGKDSEKLYVAGSLADLKKLVKPAKNTYMLLRHGESEANVNGISNSEEPGKYHLTKKGREEITARIEELKKWGVDLVVASDFLRTKESARIIAEGLGLDQNKIVYDVRLREFRVGPGREGRLWSETEAAVRRGETFEGMERPEEVKKRALAALYHIEKEHEGKKVLIVSHGAVLNTLLCGVEGEPSYDKLFHDARRHFQHTAELRPLEFVPLPHNDAFDLDLHRPYIDEIECRGEKGEILLRVPEVFDCWFESGSMPYGEACYQGKALPHFDPKGGIFKSSVGFPADFIAEGLDQTRGWFYSMLVLGVGLFGRSPYKNVIVNGIILAENGEKMSKRLKNYPDPMDVISKYGADSLRYYLLSSPVVAAQDLCFSEKGVDEVSKKLFQRLDNVLSFYEMYSSSDLLPSRSSINVLDRWILSRLDETAKEMTKWLDLYQLDKAARPLMSFVEDLSTWYLRRSRERFKSDDRADKEAALQTTRFVLKEFAKILAPFAPFYAEHLFAKVKEAKDSESVHLESWPSPVSSDAEVISRMEEVRKLVTLGLEQRSKANVKVRQPLSRLTIQSGPLAESYAALIKDEVNVKEILFIEGAPKEGAGVELDTAITPELKKEGIARDLIRAIQDARKAEGLTVGDRVALLLDSDEKGKELARSFISEIRKVTLVTDIEYAHLPQKPELIVEEYKFKIGFRR